jgi:hypothetical protein
LIVLTFGKTVVNDTATVAGNLSYQLIVFALLWFAHHNGYSVDRFRERRQSRGIATPPNAQECDSAITKADATIHS